MPVLASEIRRGGRMPSREAIDLAKERLSIPTLWRWLDLPGEPKTSCLSPFRDERHPSFSIYDRGRRAKDHATGENFDGPSFLAKARDLTIEQALKIFVALARGESSLSACYDQTSYGKKAGEVTRPKPNLSKFRMPTTQEIRAIARDRQLDLAALAITKQLGCLKTGNVCGYLSWLLTDPAGWNGEGRRFGRLTYPAHRELRERKAHTIRNSSKSWPVGLGVDQVLVREASLIIVVEGGPDLLAAWHFIYRAKRRDVLPIAILGRAVHKLHIDALQLLKGKRIKFLPHIDSDDGSGQQIRLIAHQLRKVDCQVTYFDLTGLRTRSGKPVKDLNDLVRLDANQLGELRDLLL
jgi:hypothetical protein